MESCSGRCWPQPKWLNYLLVEDWKRYAFTKQVGSKCTLPHFPLSAKTYFDSISVANCCNVHLCSKNDLLIRLETMFPPPIKPALSLSVRNILWLMSIQFYKRSTWTWNVDCGIFGLCTLIFYCLIKITMIYNFHKVFSLVLLNVATFTQPSSVS